MTEDPSSSQSDAHRPQEKSWLDKLIHTFSAEPKSRKELLDIIKEAADNKVVDSQSLEIIEGALDVADQQVREIMVPRPQMILVNIDDEPDVFLPKVIESGHSRFPVIGESSDDVRGILLAKDLLPLILGGTEGFCLGDMLRPATIIPESKRLNILLREFREDRYHMALVTDEYGGISGLVTIEDILEEIVGEIEDETDDDEDDSFIRKTSDSEFVVKALTPIEDFNEYFNAQLSEKEFGTIGGILMGAFGHLPGRNETITVSGFEFQVIYADNRQIHLLRMKLPGAASKE